MLARSLPDINLRYIKVNDDKSREILVGSNETNDTFTKSLGVLPDNTIKIFIGVEGKNDISFLINMSKVLVQNGANVPDLEKMEIDGDLIFFPLGGSNLALWTSKLQNLNRPEFHLYDRDNTPPEPPKYQDQVDLINARENCIAMNTSKKEMENYLHKDTIIAAYSEIGIDLNIPTNYRPFDDVPALVARLVHEGSGSPKPWDSVVDATRDKKISRVKRQLNSVATTHMTNEHLIEMDPDGDILDWFEKIKSLLVISD